MLLGNPRLKAHFFPKFDNQSEGARLKHDPNCVDAKCLAVTKKHSGHLVMAPPFYSKNGCANRYSRMGALLLRAHFEAVFPGAGDERFAAWWAHAEENGLCYSFECVVPRILGDHGATPEAARRNCCFFGKRQIVEEGVAYSPARRQWFAVIRYR